MDVVWMAKFISHKILKQNIGQSLIEYIFLLAIVSALSFTIFKSARFQQLFQGQSGFFATIKKGMVYSYRYGLQFQESDGANMAFDYSSASHDTYTKNGTSRFFASQGKYP
jgi:hypothetical protein